MFLSLCAGSTLLITVMLLMQGGMGWNLDSGRMDACTVIIVNRAIQYTCPGTYVGTCRTQVGSKG